MIPWALVLLRAASVAGQGLAVGGVAIALAVLTPRSRSPYVPGLRATAWLGVALGGALVAAAEAGGLAVRLAALSGEGGWPVDALLEVPALRALGLRGAVAGVLAMAALVARRRPRSGGAVGAALVLVVVGSGAGAGHVATHGPPGPGLALVALAHQLAAGVWIGGLLHLLLAYRRHGNQPWAPVLLARFSRLAAASVAALAVTGATLAAVLVGSLEAAIGTSHGAMTITKVVLLGLLLLLGVLSHRTVRRLEPGRGAPAPRIWRLIEVEAGLGLATLLLAASLAGAPPGVDAGVDHVPAEQVLARLTPGWPTLSSPSRAELAAGAPIGDPLAARTDLDRAWSEHNHNVAGLFVLAMGILASLERGGRVPPARHWPLLLLGLTAFLLPRADPVPEGVGWLEGLASPEALQHALLVLLPGLFGVFEWLVRTGRVTAPGAALVFPALAGLGGALLLGHAHGITDPRETFLMETTHLPLGVLGLVVAAGRWLELRMPGDGARRFGRLWPAALALAGCLLLLYRER